MTAAFFQRHVQACGGDREIALLDVAQDYVLEHLRREGLFAQTLAFKGGTALRKFVFGGICMTPQKGALGSFTSRNNQATSQFLPDPAKSSVAEGTLSETRCRAGRTNRRIMPVS